jgi:hypothetical protein
MIWALLAAYLTKRPPPVQAAVFGACTGLFVAAVANSDVRDPLISSVVMLVLVVGVLAGAAFYLSLRARRGNDATPPAWVHAVYTGVWLLSIGAAVRALLSAGGLKVAVLAIVPIVLLAPPALLGIRALLHRGSHADGESTAEPTAQA